MLSVRSAKPPVTETKSDIKKVQPTQVIKKTVFSAINTASANQHNLTTAKISDDSISFYDSRGDSIGGFDVKQLFKYISSSVDTDNRFMKDIDNRNEEIIKLFVGKFEMNDGNVNMIFQQKDKSPLMDDIDLLMKFNNIIYDFERGTTYLKYIDQLDVHIKHKIEQVVKHVIYQLLVNTLKMISMNENVGNEERKKVILKYSMGVVYRISQYAISQIDIQKSKTVELHKVLESSKNVMKELNIKMSELKTIMNEQDGKIERALSKLQEYQNIQLSGGKKSSDKMSESQHSAAFNI